MSFSFFDFLTLLGSLGFFIYGMKVMSEGLQKVAGAKMRQILKVMTSNRFTGVLTGFLITALVQSSSATTVMVVSFVNAGLLSLVESIGVVMGANIGTTITAWIISIIGFKIKMGALALPLIAIGFPLIFSAKNKIKSWGEVIIGFALLFMGLDLLKGSVPDIKNNPEILQFLTDYTDLGFLSILIFVLIGTLLTVVIQSSSATMALTLVMANQGWITFDIAAAMVLGENIGTTITANVAAIVANVHAKRTARAHFIFNIFGVVWMLMLFPFFLNTISSYLASDGGVSPYQSAASIPIALSIFHTTFNIINVLLLVGFTNFIAKVVTKMVKSTGEDDEFKLEYISRGLVSSSEIALAEASKEMSKFGGLVQKMLGWLLELSEEKKDRKINKLMNKIQKVEILTDELDEQINSFMIKVASSSLSEKSSIEMRGMLSISNDLERVADIIFRMSRDIERKHKNGIQFSQDQNDQLNKLSKLVEEALNIMISNLDKPVKEVQLVTALEKEQEINKFRGKLRKADLKAVENKNYDVKAGIVFREIYSGYEKIGDHLINVTEAILGLGLKDEEDLKSLEETK